MNGVPILFLSLIAVASSHVPKRIIPSIQDHCEAAGPEMYCFSARLMNNCNAKAFCKKYLLKSPCEKGPKVFCKTMKTARFCNKEAYCLTWPDDSVTAIKLRPVTPPTDPRHQMHQRGFRIRTNRVW